MRYGRVGIWDAGTGRLLTPPLQHEGGFVEHAVFSPDGRRLATTEDTSARIWDVATGQPLTSPMRHQNTMAWVAFSPNGRLVVTTSYDRTAQLWDAATGEAMGPPLLHNAAVLHARFSPDGRRLITASADGTARLWEAAFGQPDQFLSRLKVAQVAFSPDGRRLLTAGFPGSTRIWDWATGKPLSPPLLRPRPRWDVTAAFTPQGPRVVLIRRGWVIRVWDPAAGRPVSAPMRAGDGLYPPVFSPDGRYLATYASGSPLRLWEAATGRYRYRLPRPEGAVVGAEFSPDSRRIVTPGTDGTVRIWEAATGRPLGPVMKHGKIVAHACFSPDGRRVATASNDGTARVWDASTGRPISPPMRHRLKVVYVAFSPDGRRVATTSAEEAQVWDAASGQPITPPLPHNGRVERAAFSPDGHLLVTASWDHAVRVWDAATGEPVTPPLRHQSGQVHDAVFTPDGGSVISLPESSPACVWALPRDHRSITDWILLAQLFTGQRLNEHGQTVLSDSATLRRVWERLRSRYPEQFRPSTHEAGADWDQATPTVRAMEEGDRIRLQWRPLGAARGYNVYRRLAGAYRSPPVKLNTVPLAGTAFTDRASRPANRQRWTYEVTALFEEGGSWASWLEGQGRIRARQPASKLPGRAGLRLLEGPPATLSVLRPAGLPLWFGSGIDEGDRAGSARWDSSASEITLRGSGADVWYTPDGCYFLNRTVPGDFQITVRVLTPPSATHEWAKAGLMLREGLEPGARNTSLLATPDHGLILQWRPSADDATESRAVIENPNSKQTRLPMPLMLRLTRRGDTIQAEYSRDGGERFQPAGPPVAFAPPLSKTLSAGLAITSHDENQISEAKFRDLKIEALGSRR